MEDCTQTEDGKVLWWNYENEEYDFENPEDYPFLGDGEVVLHDGINQDPETELN